jgi:signal transduction histidine kinase
MGLWIVAEIVRAFGGSIRLEESPAAPISAATPPARSGACFAIDLPMRRPLAPANGGASGSSGS